MAFAIVSALTIASAATSLYVFRTVAATSQTDAKNMTERTAIAAEINRRSEHVAYLTQSARSKAIAEDLQALKSETVSEVALIRALALKLSTYEQSSRVALSLDEAITTYGAHIEVLFDSLTAKESVNLALKGSVASVRHSIALSLDQFAAQSVVWTDQLTFGSQGETSAPAGGQVGVGELLRVNSLVTRLQAIDSSILVASVAASSTGLDGARNRAALNFRDVLRLAGRRSSSEIRKAILPSLGSIVTALNEPRGVFSMASAGIDIENEIETASDASLTAARALELATEAYVEQTAFQVAESLATAEQRLKRAEIIVISLTMLAFAASILTVWLIVYRDIVRRAQRLIRAARRLAGGDLAMAVKTDGGDELTDLASALELFRQNAQKVREQEQALIALNSNLSRTNAELEQFAYIASHDLQEPLRIVVSYSELLEQRYLDEMSPDAREFMGYSVDAARRMRSLLDDLLVYSRLGRNNAEPVRVALMDVVTNAAEGLLGQESDKSVTLIYKGLPEVMAVPKLLAQAFAALFDNAIKFASDAPLEIQLTATSEGEFWRIVVRDNGIGIDKEQRERVFRIFQRLHTRTEYSGNGVGLTICKRIIEMHGGTIQVQSVEDGKGVALSFTLPKAPPDSSSG